MHHFQSRGTIVPGVDVQQRMKELVAAEAARRIESGMILGLGSGSTAALMIQDGPEAWLIRFHHDA